MTADAQQHIERLRAKSKLHLERPRERSEDAIMSLCADPSPRRMVDSVASFLGAPEKERCARCAGILRRQSSERAAAPRRAGPVAFSAQRSDLAAGFAAFIAFERAGFPPALTPETWRLSCKGAVDGRCRHCQACERDAELERLAFAAPWARQHRLRRPAGYPQWGSLDAALVALANWLAHEACSPSALGPMLDRLDLGLVGDGNASRPDDSLMRRATDVDPVGKALRMACPEGAHASLTSAQCRRLVMSRVPGVLERKPTYEELAEQSGVDAGEVRAIVRSARKTMTVELAARKLIPQPRPSLGLAEAVEERIQGLENLSKQSRSGLPRSSADGA